MAEPRWYAIQTYSGHENKVKKLIDIRIAEEPGATPEEKEIQEAIVPTQEVVEIKNGKRVTVTRRLYPGYVLVRMVANQRTQHVINNIQGVIKFVGPGSEPQPLRDDEVNKILGLAPVEEEVEPREESPFRVGQVGDVTAGRGREPKARRDDEGNKVRGLAPVEEEVEPREEIPFRVGQVVEVTGGPFADFTGTVQEVYHDKGKVKVEVSLFGRPTPVEVDY